MPMESLFPSLNDALIPYFKYRTAKYILIEVPIVGMCSLLRGIITRFMRSAPAIGEHPREQYDRVHTVSTLCPSYCF